MKIGRFIQESKRVLKVTRKPNKEEYKMVVKASGLGILVIGAIGFVIFMITQSIIG